ncbi:MAG: DUF4383 domain-containing protein [Nitrospira sp.]|nr:DUF4383 domain-containing protein [Nitrospira sp.]
MLNSKIICVAFGTVFLLVGLVGFIPNPLVSSEGIFETNLMHNFVHLLTGAAFLFGSVILEGKEQATLKTVTAAYFGVALLGFFTSGNMLLGLVHINEADRWLHLGQALAFGAAELRPVQSAARFRARASL